MHSYIDDAALGCPIKRDKNGTRAYVDWEIIEKWFKTYNII